MPEAFAVFLVTAIIVGVMIAARLQTRSPARSNPEIEAAHLDREIQWLAERIQRAERENWGEDMKAALEERHSAALKQRTLITR